MTMNPVPVDNSALAWVKEGPHLVAPGVYRIPLPLLNDGLRAVNVYAIECDAGLILIDSGIAEPVSRIHLERGLKALGAGLPDVVAFLVTHAHSDHYTQAITVRREYRTEVMIGENEKPSMALVHTPGRTTLESQIADLRSFGCDALADDLISRGYAGRAVDPTNWEYPDTWISNEHRFELSGTHLVALATPGHTRGHMVFLYPDHEVMFSGDHILPHITPSIGLEPAPTDMPLRDYLNSLQLVRDLPDMRFFPAHGNPGDSVHTRVSQLLQHHNDRLSGCLAAVESGARTPSAVAERLGWTSRGRQLRDLSLFDQMLATIETKAHLELLADRGLLHGRVGPHGLVYDVVGE
jgi:glyoxylase-like metal-dependent hydrolase (beta-lactamase superfamily II)